MSPLLPYLLRRYFLLNFHQVQFRVLKPQMKVLNMDLSVNTLPPFPGFTPLRYPHPVVSR